MLRGLSVAPKHERCGSWLLVLWTCTHLFALVAVAAPVAADVYRYIDSRGVLHFSNVPTCGEYELYVPEGQSGEASSGRRFDPYISEAAHKYGVPSSLIKAIIKAESGFEPNAVSDKGACGLMQIMPETARDLGLSDTFDPRENILAGVRYFDDLMRQFQGSVSLALAAYNAGPSRVSALGRMPRIRETERFVHKVMEYFNHP
jgi:soluble lytic murein transglycosylase